MYIFIYVYICVCIWVYNYVYVCMIIVHMDSIVFTCTCGSTRVCVCTCIGYMYECVMCLCWFPFLSVRLVACYSSSDSFVRFEHGNGRFGVVLVMNPIHRRLEEWPMWWSVDQYRFVQWRPDNDSILKLRHFIWVFVLVYFFIYRCRYVFGKIKCIERGFTVNRWCSCTDDPKLQMYM